MVPRGALSTFLDSISKQIRFEPGQTHLAITTIGFDISILELFFRFAAVHAWCSPPEMNLAKPRDCAR